MEIENNHEMQSFKRFLYVARLLEYIQNQKKGRNYYYSLLLQLLQNLQFRVHYVHLELQSEHQKQNYINQSVHSLEIQQMLYIALGVFHSFSRLIHDSNYFHISFLLKLFLSSRLQRNYKVPIVLQLLQTRSQIQRPPANTVIW